MKVKIIAAILIWIAIIALGMWTIETLRLAGISP